MAFRDTLATLRDELAAARSTRLQEAREADAQLEQSRAALRQLAARLEITPLLEEMNAILLNGNGSLETFVSWEADDADDDLDDPGFNLVSLEPDGGEVPEGICISLSWEEDGECAIDVELADADPSLMVNGVAIRPEREALEQALIVAFREELEL